MKKIVIFGAGDTGAAAFREYGRSRVLAFADNIKKGEFCGLPIWDIEELKKRKGEYELVVASVFYENEIISALTAVGITNFIINRNVNNYNEHDKEKLNAFCDIHKNESCFIIGTGPSLRMDDLEILRREKICCFGTNKIFLSFDKVIWRPDYYLIIDRRQIEQYAEEISALPIKHKFVSLYSKTFWKTDLCDGSLAINMVNENYTDTLPSFSDDIRKCVFEGNTVTYAAIQVAAYMGFKKIYLLGVDFDYSKDMLSGQNHFTDNYFKPEEVYLASDEHKVILAYQKAEKYSRENGFRIYNATRGGKLEVFERVDFDSKFNNYK